MWFSLIFHSVNMFVFFSLSVHVLSVQLFLSADAVNHLSPNNGDSLSQYHNAERIGSLCQAQILMYIYLHWCTWKEGKARLNTFEFCTLRRT